MFFHYFILGIIGIGSSIYLIHATRELIRVMIPTIAGGGIFVGTPAVAIATMIELAEIKPTDIVMDLGSGDGRLLIAAAKAGAKKSSGYEIQHWLVKQSRELVENEHLKDKIEIHPDSFWHVDVSNTNLVLLYQISYAMKGIEKKLQKELPVGARVVANGFKFPKWKEEKTIDNVRLYIKK
jgi:hypothetical protein